MFFRLSSFELGLILFAVVFGTTGLGLVLGHFFRHRSEHLREAFGVLQGALLGLVGLVLAFGLALAVGRYESRRAAVVDDANAIGTTYLRAQTLAEPIRTRSLELPACATRTPASASPTRYRAPPVAPRNRRRREAAARALGACGTGARRGPRASAPRLYVETLNEMIDMQTVRVAALNNRVPGSRARRRGGLRGGRARAPGVLPRDPRPRRAARFSRRRDWSGCCCSSRSISTGRRAASSAFPRRRSRASAHRWSCPRPPPRRPDPDGISPGVTHGSGLTSELTSPLASRRTKSARLRKYWTPRPPCSWSGTVSPGPTRLRGHQWRAHGRPRKSGGYGGGPGHWPGPNPMTVVAVAAPRCEVLGADVAPESNARATNSQVTAAARTAAATINPIR